LAKTSLAQTCASKGGLRPSLSPHLWRLASRESVLLDGQDSGAMGLDLPAPRLPPTALPWSGKQPYPEITSPDNKFPVVLNPRTNQCKLATAFPDHGRVLLTGWSVIHRVIRYPGLRIRSDPVTDPSDPVRRPVVRSQARTFSAGRGPPLDGHNLAAAGYSRRSQPVQIQEWS